MINAVLVFNNSGQPRLTKFYTQLDTSVQQRLISEIFTLVSNRPASACNFLPLPPLLAPPSTSTTTTDPGHYSDSPTNITYRHYATLYFILISTSTESPLALLDLIQVFVESLDSLFNNVCELDLIFNFEAMHACLAEMVVGGVVVETRVKEIVKGVRDSDKGSVRGKEPKMGPVGAVGRGMWAGRKAILCIAMAQAPPQMARRLSSFMIRKHAAFPTADQKLPSSIPESPVSYVTTGAKHDATSGFKRLANFSYANQWRGNGNELSRNPSTLDFDVGKYLDSVDGRRSANESRPKDAVGKLPYQGRLRTDDGMVEEPSQSKGPGLVSTPDNEYNPERTSPQGVKEMVRSATNSSGAPVKQETNKIPSRDQIGELPRIPARGVSVWKLGTTKFKKLESLPIRRLGSLRVRKFGIEFSDQQVHAQPFSTSTRRLDASPPKPSEPEPISIDQYHRLADHYIDTLVARLEELQEERRDVDCEYSAGVLNLDFPPAGTYVFNKQPPNKQIWLSSPISGPKRYDYVLTSPSTPETSDDSTGGDGAARSGVGIEGEEQKGEWVYLRDGSTLTELLKEELGIDMDEEG
ncbi:MAG: hypothetical protein LQ339_003906 [Xanthoria mediterranea]|nr:MAG: hypothetical protein LQ339_003906 [Xanthoria mediterranea]